MERTLSSDLVFESNAQQSNASLPLRVLATLMLWQRRMASRRQLARLDARLLADAGISEAQRYEELSKPSGAKRRLAGFGWHPTFLNPLQVTATGLLFVPHARGQFQALDQYSLCNIESKQVQFSWPVPFVNVRKHPRMIRLP